MPRLPEWVVSPRVSSIGCPVPHEVERILHSGWVQLPTGVQAVATVSGLAAAYGPVMLARSAYRWTGGRGQAQRLFAVGAGLAALSAIVGLVGLVGYAGHWTHHQPQRMTLASMIAVGMAASGLLLCAGLLRLPGVASGVNAVVRLILDGLVIASALWFVGWVLLAEPTRLFGAEHAGALPGDPPGAGDRRPGHRPRPDCRGPVA